MSSNIWEWQWKNGLLITSWNHRNNQPWRHFTSGLLVLWGNNCVDYLRHMGLSLISILTGKGKNLDNAPTPGNSHTVFFPLSSLLLACEALYLKSSGTLPDIQGDVQADTIVGFGLPSVPLPNSPLHSQQLVPRVIIIAIISYAFSMCQKLFYVLCTQSHFMSSFTRACNHFMSWDLLSLFDRWGNGSSEGLNKFKVSKWVT